jgi:tetratricopeptide (TPR) repeat protein
MTDPQRTDRPADAGEVPERERDTRVESLLVAGLDHYFAGQHELAISVWTRVLFLDRGHARAKAYIDRARSAMAERQREGDELLHTGAAAIDRGDAGAARDLLKSAAERGATDEALALLDRLNRFEQPNVKPARSSAPPLVEQSIDPPLAVVEKTGAARAVWISVGVLTGLALSGLVAWVGITRPDWLPLQDSGVATPVTEVSEPLPVPSSAELSLSRARTLYEDGRLRDALVALEAIGQADPLRRDANELRAAIQRRLLEASRLQPVQ